MSTKYCSYGRSPNLAVCLILYMFSWAYWSTLTSTLSSNSRKCCLAFEGCDHDGILSKFEAKIAWFKLDDAQKSNEKENRYSFVYQYFHIV